MRKKRSGCNVRRTSAANSRRAVAKSPWATASGMPSRPGRVVCDSAARIELPEEVRVAAAAGRLSNPCWSPPSAAWSRNIQADTTENLPCDHREYSAAIRHSREAGIQHPSDWTPVFTGVTAIADLFSSFSLSRLAPMRECAQAHFGHIRRRFQSADFAVSTSCIISITLARPASVSAPNIARSSATRLSPIRSIHLGHRAFSGDVLGDVIVDVAVGGECWGRWVMQRT